MDHPQQCEDPHQKEKSKNETKVIESGPPFAIAVMQVVAQHKTVLYLTDMDRFPQGSPSCEWCLNAARNLS